MRSRLARLLLLAVLMLVIGVLGVPGVAGAAANHETSLTATALNSTITWGGYTILTGTLMDETALVALGGQMLRVEWSPTGAPLSWTLLATVSAETGSPQYTAGQYPAVVYPTALTYYRFNFLGSPGYDIASSNVLIIHVKPALGVPNVPGSAKVNKSFTVSGSLKPQFPAGATTVTLNAYRYNGSKWVAYKTYKAVNADNGTKTKYSLSIKISKTGKYRFTASTAKTAQYSAVTTANSASFQVK
jgi:hypothetical protein